MPMSGELIKGGSRHPGSRPSYNLPDRSEFSELSEGSELSEDSENSEPPTPCLYVS